MLQCTFTWLIVIFTCVHSISGIAVANSTFGEEETCKERNSPGWTVNTLQNVTLDLWPWTCLQSRYTSGSLHALVAQSTRDIYVAARKGYFGFVQYYAEKFGLPQGDNVTELLHQTAKGGSLNILKYLVEKNGLPIDVNDTVLLLSAAYGGNVDLIRYLVYNKKLTKTGTDPDSGDTALHEAASAGRLNAARFFVEILNYEVDARNIYDETPLLRAAETGQLAVIKYLFEERMADLFAKNEFGTSVLHFAAFSGNLELVKYVIQQQRLNIELRDNRGNTPLQEAVSAFNKSGTKNVIKYLVEEKKADLNTTNDFGSTLLHTAVSVHNLNVLKFLIDGMNMSSYIEKKDLAENTVAMYAAQEGALPILQYLLDERNANISTVDSLGHNLLHAAARNNQFEVVKYLVEEKNFKVDKKTASGKTAYDLVVENHDLQHTSDLLKYLQEKMKETLSRQTIAVR